ncbi:uncharacterized protein LOC134722840 [Mytilus trossulus]|uniref:uncharacterized protein LOC134722840 n=1 Tax=Mytilus trossulus TaxID=6551 RepID=UPI0030050CFE
MTLPKLELMAAVIGARMAKNITKTLKPQRIVLWSDSQIVLHWISSLKSFGRIVQNRVIEIKESTQNYDWKYVPTDSNPADLQTRGISSTQFKESTLWMQGPSWISDENSWPTWTPQEIERVINDRPITYVSSDIRDPEPLTPSHLLQGRTLSQENNSDSEDNNFKLDFTEANKRFNHKVALIEHFAKRWRMEYLTGLREFHRVAGDKSAHVKIGSVVQIINNSPRMMWKLAVIEDLITGKDEVVRAVKLRTSNGLITTRPIVKLVPLEI